jgi:acetate kinase
MNESVVVINCGSSSLKFAAFPLQDGRVAESAACHALADRLESEQARIEFSGQLRSDISAQETRGVGHLQALERIFEHFARASGAAAKVAAVGHRVVHGAETFASSTLLDAGTIAQIRACSLLAPLHNPANVLGIEAAKRLFPAAPHVAVFDTAFHQTMPARAHLYALPYELYERHKIRRYGFHGTSHQYVAEQAARALGKPLAELSLITIHLGNGCSACAIEGGRSLDTSMGFTPLEGLVMGTRSGDVDPNLHQFLARETGRSLEQITELLNRQSGLLGLSGRSNDMRTLLTAAAAGDARAQLSIDVFCYRLAKGVFALCAALDKLDALVFTGGIGQHAAAIRAHTARALKLLGVQLDPELNAAHGVHSNGRISPPHCAVSSWVVATNEELAIAREAVRFIPNA